MVDGVLVVIPTLGERLDMLALTLESVSIQTEVETTLVVVVPRAATGARDVARGFGALIVDDPRSGLSGAINAGVSAATNETYLAWAGDDDIYRPGGLAHLRDLLRSNPAASVSYAGCDYIDLLGEVVRVSRWGRLATLLIRWGPDFVPQPASLIRLDALAKVGGYNEDLRYAMDLDAFLRLLRVGPFVSSRQVVAAFRWHSGSLTVSQHGLSTREGQAVKRKYLPRFVRPLAPLWDAPIRLASHLAAQRVVGRR